MHREYEKVTIKCEEEIAEEIFDLFCQKFIREFDEIDKWFNIKYEKLCITLLSKTNLNKVVKNKGEQYKNSDVPDWIVGFSNFEEAWVVIPNQQTLEELYKVALHEIIHLISYRLDSSHKRIKLLDEGIAVFLSNQYEGNIYTPWVNAYLKTELPKISDFCTYSGVEFAQKKGYRYSYLIIEFLISKYGKETFIKWLENPIEFMEKIDEIEKTFDEYIVDKLQKKTKHECNFYLDKC